MFVTSLPGLSSSHLVAAEAPAAPALGIDPAIFAIVLFGITTIIGVVAVLGGTGGGVIFTPLLMGFTPINSYIIVATDGSVTVMFGGCELGQGSTFTVTFPSPCLNPE